MARSSKGSKGEKLSLNEREFLLASLAEGRRLDGRGLYDYRTLKISFPYQPGYCEVQLGQTRYHFSSILTHRFTMPPSFNRNLPSTRIPNVINLFQTIWQGVRSRAL